MNPADALAWLNGPPRTDLDEVYEADAQLTARLIAAQRAVTATSEGK